MATPMNTAGGGLSGRPIFKLQESILGARDNHYHHPANAIAELIDNAIDANARRVELIIKENTVQLPSGRSSYRIHELAVIDNGTGMDPETLAEALRFGGRTIGPGIRKIGKYGFGLPTSSVTQCKRVDVWSWQQGIENANHSYLDIDEIQAGSQQEINAEPQPPPAAWTTLARNVSNAGTLVVWSKIDRITTTRPETIFKRLEEEVGRIYRHYINGEELRIRMAAFRDNSSTPREDTEVRPNDPSYLMAPSSTPAPYDQDPMFTVYHEETIAVNNGKTTENVHIRYSIVKPETLGVAGGYPGSTDYGRHARRNMGISVVRENREIILDDSMVNTEAGGGGLPQNRWWGCEVRFGAGCDDLFGVDHNKQMTAHFSHALKELSASNLDDTRVRDEIDGNESFIYDVAESIRRTIRNMMRDIKLRMNRRPHQNNGKQTSTNPEQIAEFLATQATVENLENPETEKTETDIKFESSTPEEKISGIVEQLTQAEYPEEQAKQEAEETVKGGYRYKFAKADLSAFTVFNASNAAGVLVVRLNINHPVYRYLETLQPTNTEEKNNVRVGLLVAILALARMDDEAGNEVERLKFQDTCYRWGRVMAKIIDEGPVNVDE